MPSPPASALLLPLVGQGERVEVLEEREYIPLEPWQFWGHRITSEELTVIVGTSRDADHLRHEARRNFFGGAAVAAFCKSQHLHPGRGYPKRTGPSPAELVHPGPRAAAARVAGAQSP